MDSSRFQNQKLFFVSSAAMYFTLLLNRIPANQESSSFYQLTVVRTFFENNIECTTSDLNNFTRRLQLTWQKYIFCIDIPGKTRMVLQTFIVKCTFYYECYHRTLAYILFYFKVLNIKPTK